MEYLINNNTNLINLKEIFDNNNTEDQQVIEYIDEETNSVHTSESGDIEEEIIPESFFKEDLDIELIPSKLLEKKLCREFLKEEDKEYFFLYYFNDRENVLNHKVEEKFKEIERKVYYSFYKLLQTEEWEEILYEKIIESDRPKEIFLYYFSCKELISGLSFKEDTKDKFINIVHSLLEEIDL